MRDEDDFHRAMPTAQLLAQDEYWCPRDNSIIRIASMEFGHLDSARTWLLGNCGWLYEEVSGASAPRGSGQGSAWAWMRSTPLYKAIDQAMGGAPVASVKGRQIEAVATRRCRRCRSVPGEKCRSLRGTGRELTVPHAERWAREEWIVVVPHAVTAGGHHETEYSWDGRRFAGKDGAVSHGFTLGAADDFQVAPVISDELTGLWWMDHDLRPEPGQLEVIARQIGLS